MQNSYDKDYIINLRKKILEKSISVECNVVATFWKNPDLYMEYSSEVFPNMFKSELWRLYYSIGEAMTKKGFKHIDDISVFTFLDDKVDMKDKYIGFGGYGKVELVIDLVKESNIEAHIDSLKKYSAIYDYVTKLSLTESGIEKLANLDNVEEIYNFLSIKINDVFRNTSIAGSRSGKITDDLDSLIDIADKGINKGLPFNSPILSEEIGGLMLGQIILVGGLSGTGKTTFTQELHLSAMWEREESTVYILNEQPKEKWQQQFLTWIINNKIIPQDSNERFSSKRWRDGHFTDKEKEWLYKAKEMLESKVRDNLIVIEELETYTRKNVEKIIKRYAHLGIQHFVIDTFKISADHKGELFWFEMSNDMRCLDDLVKPSNLNVNLWVTLQLEKGAVLKRYLTGNNIGQSKNVVDTASAVLLMRRVRNDEYKGGKNELKVIKPFSKDCMTSGEQVDLDPNKQYVVIFIDKNRSGRSQEFQIVAHQNLGTLQYEEVGICSIAFDS